MPGIRRREFITNVSRSFPSGGQLRTPSSPNDRFTWRPWAWALCLWSVVWLPSILLYGFADLVNIIWWLVVTIPVFTVAVAAALIFFVINLFRRRWRAATSIVLASITFAFAVYVSREFH